jgi:outer membrane protein
MIQMKLLKMSLAPVAALLVLTAGPAFARPVPADGPNMVEDGQAPAAPATQAPTTQPPPTQPPATQPTPTAPKAQLQPPAPFPQGAKIAFVNIPAIAQNSSAGKDATKKLSDLNTKKVAEINDKQKQLQAMQTKLGQGATVLNDTARAQLEKDIDKLQRDIQFAQQNAQAEMNELQTDLQGEFQQKLIPVIKQVAEEKGLHAVFSISDSGVAYYDPGLDISEEVVKRLDTAKPSAPVKK